MAADSLPVVVVVRDLMFSSRISATARAAGRAVKMLRDPATLGSADGRLLIVDLNQAGTIEAARQWLDVPNRRAVGFVSHVDAATIAAAREAGIDAMPRSRFVEVLPELLSSGTGNTGESHGDL